LKIFFKKDEELKKMKTYIRVLALLAIIPQVSLARPASNNIDDDLDRELDHMYTNNPSARRMAEGRSINGGGVVNPQPIYIVNQATPSANSTQMQSAQQIQRQPVTIIQDTPLEDSRADQLRRARQGAELQTEQKIVEKLERDRLEDEQKRLQSLLNSGQQNVGPGAAANSSNQMQGASQNISVIQTPSVVQPVAPAPAVPPAQQPLLPVQQPPLQPTQPIQAVPVQAVQPVQPIYNPPPVVVDREEDYEKGREEIRGEIVEKKVKEHLSVNYFSALLGVGEYPDAQNVQGNYVLGVSYGAKYENYAVEGSLFMANYGLNQAYVDPYYAYNVYVIPMEVNQYSGAIALKYFMLSGTVRPILGGVVQYSYRTYVGKNNAYTTNYGPGAYYPGNNYSPNANSHAIDVGAVTGVDLELSRSTTIGLDFRYMVNMYSRANANGNSIYGPGFVVGTPLEKMQYYITSLSLRMTF